VTLSEAVLVDVAPGVGVGTGVAVGALVTTIVGVAAGVTLAAGLAAAAIAVVEVAPGWVDGFSFRPMYSIEARYTTARTSDAPIRTRRSAWTRTIFPRSQ